MLALTVVLAAAILGFVQIGSDALFASAAVPGSLPARLSPALGRRIYDLIDRVAPAPYVEAMLARAALNRGDLSAAAKHARALPASAQRSDLLGLIARAKGQERSAQRYFLEADDIFAIDADVNRLARRDPVAAYRLEMRFKTRLSQLRTHPDAVAEAYWRLGELATQRAAIAGPARSHWMHVGMRDYRQAIALAPLAEKYLLAAGAQAINMRRWADAQRYYRRAASVDPASADAYAGMGLAALHSGDRRAALRYAARSRSFNPHARILHTLETQLRQ